MNIEEEDVFAVLRDETFLFGMLLLRRNEIVVPHQERESSFCAGILTLWCIDSKYRSYQHVFVVPH